MAQVPAIIAIPQRTGPLLSRISQQSTRYAAWHRPPTMVDSPQAAGNRTCRDGDEGEQGSAIRYRVCRQISAHLLRRRRRQAVIGSSSSRDGRRHPRRSTLCRCSPGSKFRCLRCTARVTSMSAPRRTLRSMRNSRCIRTVANACSTGPTTSSSSVLRIPIVNIVILRLAICRP